MADEKPNVVESADWESHGRGQFSDAAIDAIARLLVDLDRKRRNGEIKAPWEASEKGQTEATATSSKYLMLFGSLSYQ